GVWVWVSWDESFEPVKKEGDGEEGDIQADDDGEDLAPGLRIGPLPGW
ncbi:unnamed protein product, partial [marine sediment metagenome]